MQPNAPPPSYAVASTQPQPGYNQYGQPPAGSYNPQPGYPPPNAQYGAPSGYANPSGGAPGAGFGGPIHTGQGVYQAGHTVVVGGGPSTGFSREPVNIKCTQCGADVVTETKFKIGSGAMCLMLICILMGCWLGCCLIPFCVNGYKDVEHYCPNCNAHIGTCPANSGVRVGHR